MSARRDSLRRRVLGRLVAIFLLAVAVGFTAQFVLGGGADEHRYRLLFENAGQLVDGNEVQIGGHPVGKIEDISLTEESVAQIDVTVEQKLHEGTTAIIRSTSLAGIANRYVALSPGPNSEPALDDGAVLGTSATTAPVDLDQLLNSFTPRTREGLSNFIKGQGQVYADSGPEANSSYKYFHPALSQTNRVLAELNQDERLFERFIVGSARVFSALGERNAELASSIGNARTAFGAIASENRSVDETLERLPDTFRQSNTAFVNLRAALDDLDSLVNTAKPATSGLAAFLADARPAIADSVPFFRDFRKAVALDGPDNDLGELTALLPAVSRAADQDFGRAEQAIADFQPTLDFARPYAPEMVNGLAKLGQITGYYDANGHYARTILSGLNLFDVDTLTNLLEPAASADQFAPYGDDRILKRCPGAATQSAPDGSNPFSDPPWTGSALTGSECDPADIPEGP